MLKWSALLLIGVLLLLAACEPAGPRVWTTFTPDDRSFSIDVPEGFEVLDMKQRTAFGERQEVTVHWRIDAFRIATMDIKNLECSYLDIADVTRRMSRGRILDSCARFFIDSLYAISEYGRVVKLDTASIGAFPGRALVAVEDVNKDDSLIVFVRYYLVRDRLYTLLINGYKSYTDEAQVDRFLGSFRIGGL